MVIEQLYTEQFLEVPPRSSEQFKFKNNSLK